MLSELKSGIMKPWYTNNRANPVIYKPFLSSEQLMSLYVDIHPVFWSMQAWYPI